MHHLTPEALARLVDEAPTPDELAHLDACPRCADALARMGALTGALAQLPDPTPPRDGWQMLSARLAAEGLLRPSDASSRIGWSWTRSRWIRAAAAVVLFAGGLATGLSLDGGASAGTVSPRDAATLEEAVDLVRTAERRYVDALVQYRQLSGDVNDATTLVEPERRFAALDYLLAAGRVAVEQAPADPFMNGLLANILAERQATRDLIMRTTGTVQEWF